MQLYYNRMSSNSRKARMVAARLGMALDLIELDMVSGEHSEPEYLAVNPNGLVPTLVDGQTTLTESNAICHYLTSHAPNDLVPASTEELSQVLKWQFWEQAHWAPNLRIFVVENMYKELLGLGAPDQELLEATGINVRRFGSVLDTALSERKFLVGSNVSLADYSVASHLMYAEQAMFPLEEFKNIHAWFERIASLTEWMTTEPQ